MKNIITAAIFSAATALASAQAPTYVYVETKVQGADTLRTFYVEGNHCKMLINAFTASFGTPNGEGTGTMKWANAEIPGLGSGLTIEANDGARIFTQATEMWSFSTFLNAADMEAKLSADPARARRMYITVKKGSKNKVTTAATEQAFVAYGEQIILAE